MEVCTGSCRLVLHGQCNALAPAREKKSNGIQHQKKKHKVCSLDVSESSTFIGEKMAHGPLTGLVISQVITLLHMTNKHGFANV